MYMNKIVNNYDNLKRIFVEYLLKQEGLVFITFGITTITDITNRLCYGTQ